MKILFLAPQPFFVERGTPIAVRTVVESLAADGHAVDLLTYHEGRDIDIPGVRHLRIARPPMVRRIPIGPSWQKAVCDLWLLRAAWRAAARGRYDIAHAVEEAAFIAMLLKRRLGLPFAYDMDSLMSEQVADKSPLLRPAAAVFARLETAAVRESEGVLAVCPALADMARPLHPRAHIVLLPDTPLHDGDAALPDPEVAAIGGVKLVYVGNLEHYQGVDLALRAFALVADEHPGSTLVIVGGGSERATRDLARLAPGLIASGRVRFLGPRPLAQLGAILAAGDVLLSPRRAGRNTPMKIYSYLESGRPILATRLPTHTQVLTDTTALLVDADPASMAAGMRRLITSADLREQIGSSGRALVRRDYSTTVVRRRLREFYSDIAAASARPAPAHADPAGGVDDGSGSFHVEPATPAHAATEAP